MAALQEPASTFLPTFTVVSDEKNTSKRVNSFILIENSNICSSAFIEKLGSDVPTIHGATPRPPERILLEQKVPTVSNSLHEALENDNRVSKDPIRAESGWRSGSDVEVQEKLAHQDVQSTSTRMDGLRRSPVPMAVKESPIPPPQRTPPPLPAPPDSAPPQAESFSSQAECYCSYHNSQQNRRTKRFAERLMGSLKRNYRDVRGGRLERETLVGRIHEGCYEHNDPDSRRPIQQGSSDCRVDSGVAIVSPVKTQPQVFPKSKQKIRTWIRSLSGDFRSNHDGGVSMTAGGMRSRLSSFTSKAKRLFPKSRSRKSSRSGSTRSEPPPENPLYPSIPHPDSPRQEVSVDSGTKNIPFRSHDLGPSTGTPDIQNSTYNESPPLQRYSSYAVYEENGLLELDIRIITGGPPLPFQCTFCLKPCGEESDWIQHEWSHFPQRGWTCMINGQTHVQNGWVCCSFCGDTDQKHDFSPHNTNRCSNKRILDRTFTTESEMKRHLHTVHGNDHVMASVMQSWNWPQCMDEWYWYCGFCNTVLPSWDKRKDHLNEHFRNGETMSTWDPLTSPYPWSKQSSTLIPGFSQWQPAKLLAIQQHTILDLINKVAEPRQLNQCDLCNITPFATFGEFTRHMSLWHHPKKSWSCPSLAGDWELMDFFESYLERREESTQETHFCLCCGKEFFKVSANSDMLKKHLQDEHQFSECHHDKIFTPELFSLHLANTHHVGFNYVGGFAALCQKDERPPALMMWSKGGRDAFRFTAVKRAKNVIAPHVDHTFHLSYISE